MHVKKSTIFLVGCLAVLIGVGVRSAVVIPMVVWFSLAVMGVIVIIVLGRWRWGVVLAVACLGLSFGVARYAWSVPTPTAGDIQYYNNQTVTFIGTVVGEPDTRADHVKLTIATQSLADRRLVDGRVLVNTKLYPQYQYGDQLIITCALEQPEVIRSEGGRDFQYDQYLALFHIYSVCYRPSITVLGHDQGNRTLALIFHIKSQFVEQVTQAISEPEASFVGGLILGSRKSIPAYLIEAFSRTGTTHIIALSGYNITIIAVFIQNLCRSLWIHRRYAFWISLCAIVFFVVLTGAPASVTRAGIMGGLVLLARQLGRMNRITNSLILAAVIMVLINPQVLLYDAGFQLSFLSTVGLVYFSPILERVFRWVPQTFELRSSLTATLSAILFTLPLIIVTFGRLSIIAPVVNVIILPLIPFAMALGFATGIAGLLFAPLGMMIGWLAWALLRLILGIIEWFGSLPHIAVQLPVVGWVWIGAAYTMFGLLIWKYNHKPSTRMEPTAVR